MIFTGPLKSFPFFFLKKKKLPNSKLVVYVFICSFPLRQGKKYLVVNIACFYFNFTEDPDDNLDEIGNNKTSLF